MSGARNDSQPIDRFAVDQLLTDSAENLFASTCSFDRVQKAEEDGWAPEIWDAVADAGFAWIGLDESAGGSGGSLLDTAEVLRIAGANAAPIPLAETAMLGGWLLAKAGLAIPDGPVSVIATPVIGTRNTDGSISLSGVASRVPWADKADVIAAMVQLPGGAPADMIAAIDPATVRIEAKTNLAGEPRPNLHLDGVTVPAEHAVIVEGADPADELQLRGALSRTMLMAGALEAMSNLTVQYTEERKQFGRPVGRFQAVQQHLVWGAQDAAIANMTGQLAAAKAAAGVLEARFEIAAARTIADECAATATRAAHQAHGAMGMTQEYALHHLSRRLWAWRHEFASPGRWPTTVGALAERAGPDRLYPLIAT